jgi:Arc/MetJ-type ribon-helix-helix transcriptional regulator
MKTKIYSLRMSQEVRRDLERVARSRKVKVSQVIHTALREWLAQNQKDISNDKEQRRLHAIAARLIGTIHSGKRDNSTRVREIVQAHLAEKHGR